MHPIDVLVVGGEPQLILHVALRLEALWRDDLTHAKRLGVPTDTLDVSQRVFKFCLGWPEHRRLQERIENG